MTRWTQESSGRPAAAGAKAKQSIGEFEAPNRGAITPGGSKRRWACSCGRQEGWSSRQDRASSHIHVVRISDARCARRRPIQEAHLTQDGALGKMVDHSCPRVIVAWVALLNAHLRFAQELVRRK
eukprot:scaffold20842_cov33-Tisochrysis_lutea.AAC.2